MMTCAAKRRERFADAADCDRSDREVIRSPARRCVEKKK
jgi:hypothetical protein